MNRVFWCHFQYFIYILQIFTLYINISYLCILSEYRITLNGHNYEVEVSGVCLFVRPYAVNFSKVPPHTQFPMYHTCSSGEEVPKKCCLYLSGAIWNRGGTLTSDWLRHFQLLLLNNCRWSHQTCQICFSVLYITWTI